VTLNKTSEEKEARFIRIPVNLKSPRESRGLKKQEGSQLTHEADRFRGLTDQIRNPYGPSPY